MRLTEEEFIKYVCLFEEMLIEERKVMGALRASGDWVCGEWIEEFYNLLRDMCGKESSTYLDWYCFDTNFGTVNTTFTYPTGCAELTLNINSPKKLYKLIVSNQNSEE